MDTVRDGLRAHELEKDTFDRLICTNCDRPLKMENNPDQLGKIRRCPECGTEWHEMR